MNSFWPIAAIEQRQKVAGLASCERSARPPAQLAAIEFDVKVPK
jgi:hypothetical protein